MKKIRFQCTCRSNGIALSNKQKVFIIFIKPGSLSIKTSLVPSGFAYLMFAEHSKADPQSTRTCLPSYTFLTDSKQSPYSSSAIFFLFHTSLMMGSLLSSNILSSYIEHRNYFSWSWCWIEKGNRTMVPEGIYPIENSLSNTSSSVSIGS